MRRLMGSFLSLSLLVGCTPETVDLSADQLLTLRDGPDTLVDADGEYRGGWYRSFDGRLNAEDASAPAGDFKRFLHVQFDDPDWFVVGNIAELGSASNVAVLAVEKATGTFHSVSLSALFGDNVVEVDAAHTRFYDPTTKSTLTLVDGALTMDLHAGGLSLVGRAVPAFEDDFVQVTRFHEGHGSYQTWAFVTLEEGTLTLEDGRSVPLAAGTVGAIDRTVGHQRRSQNWNWLAVAGVATDADTGETAPFALSLQEDRPEARPWVDAHKHPAWAGDDFGKIEEVVFDYQSDPETRETGDWSITGTGLDLSFRPDHHRRDLQGEIWIAETDFNQYYGLMEGQFELAGRTWQLGPVFALCEDSLIRL